VTVFSLVTHSAGWIYVWPVAMAGKPEALVYVNTANVWLFGMTYVVICPPRKYIMQFTTILFVLFAIPLFIVAFKSGDITIFKVIVSDSSESIFGGIIMAGLIHNLYLKLSKLELEKAEEAKKFLGPTISKAIFENRRELLEKRMSSGFLLSTDIRGYTNLVLKGQKENVTALMEKYFEVLSETVGHYGGIVHKTAGDGHIISFGLMDYDADLSDIVGLEGQDLSAKARLRQSQFDSITACLATTIDALNELSTTHGFGDQIRVGAALDFGEVEIKVVGDSQYRKELDIFGDALIRCVRLQDYTKVVSQHIKLNPSFLVLSPTVMNLSIDLGHVTYFETTGYPVRDFPEIKKIAVKELDRVYRFSSRKRKAG
jgi:class 3 adenylate cyclase